MSTHPVPSWGSRPETPSNAPTYGEHASPLSFTGTTHRHISWINRGGGPVRWTLGISSLVLVYLVVATWYLLLAFNVLLALTSVLFFAATIIGLFFLPLPMAWLFLSLVPFGFRSHRKTQRKNTKQFEDQLSALQAIQKNTDK